MGVVSRPVFSGRYQETTIGSLRHTLRAISVGSPRHFPGPDRRASPAGLAGTVEQDARPS